MSGHRPTTAIRACRTSRRITLATWLALNVIKAIQKLLTGNSRHSSRTVPVATGVITSPTHTRNQKIRIPDMPRASFATAPVPATCIRILISQRSKRIVRDLNIEYLTVTFDYPISPDQALAMRCTACSRSADRVRWLGIYCELSGIGWRFGRSLSCRNTRTIQL